MTSAIVALVSDHSVLVQHQPSNDRGSTGEGLTGCGKRRGLDCGPSARHFLHQSIRPELSVFDTMPPCPNPKGREVIDTATGAITFVPHRRGLAEEGDAFWRCEKNTCFSCTCVNGQRIAYATQLSTPTHHISITQVGPTASVITTRMTTLSYYVRQAVPEFRWVWAAEENPGENGVHTHGYFHTGKRQCDPGQKLFNDASRRAGFGRVHYDEIEGDLPVEFYGYPMKTLSSPGLAEHFHELNGSPRRRRLIHASRGYWRDGPSGEPITRAEAEHIAYRRSRSWARSRAVEVHTQIHEGDGVNRSGESRSVHAESPSGIQKESA